MNDRFTCLRGKYIKMFNVEPCCVTSGAVFFFNPVTSLTSELYLAVFEYNNASYVATCDPDQVRPKPV